jgi:hypothetical protein
MSHHTRLPLRLRSRNSQLQLAQILIRAEASSQSSPSADFASAAVKAMGASPVLPNLRSVAGVGESRLVFALECRRAGAQQPRQGSRRLFAAPCPGAKQRVDRLAQLDDAVLRGRGVRHRHPPAAQLVGAVDGRRLGEAGDLAGSRNGRSRAGSPRSTTVFAMSSASAPPEKRCGVQSTAMANF